MQNPGPVCVDVDADDIDVAPLRCGEITELRWQFGGGVPEWWEAESPLFEPIPLLPASFLSCLLLPFSTSHNLWPRGGLPRAARAPCISKRLNEKSGKLNAFRLLRLISECDKWFLNVLSRALFVDKSEQNLMFHWQFERALLTITHNDYTPDFHF